MSSLSEPRLRRAVPLAAASVPFVVAVVIIMMQNQYFGEGFTAFIRHDRSTAQIIVQTLSQILGFLQIYSFHAAMQFSTRARLVKRPTRLDTLGYLMALSNGQIDTSLSISRVLVTVCLAMLSFGPGAVWAGAITPLIAQRSEPVAGGVQIPIYSDNTTHIWNAEFQTEDGTIWNRVSNCIGVGIVTSCPVPALQGPLLYAMASASTSNGSVRRHSKTDESSWTYVGRSYGVGSSIGQTTASIVTPSTLTLNYLESGYVANVTCSFNSSSAYSINEIGNLVGQYTDVGLPTGVFGYSASGYLPNSFNDVSEYSPGEDYTVLSSFDNSQDVLAWSARSIAGQNYISIAATNGSYSQFNQTQCVVQFEPWDFNVFANFTSRTIQVTPLSTVGNESSTTLPQPEILVNVVDSINLLGRMSSSLYTSVTGDALNHNLAFNSGTSPAEDGILASLQDSFTVALDDILGAYGVSQLIIAKDMATVPAQTTSDITYIGKPLFSRLALAMSLLFMVIQLCFIARTRFWRSLPVFNIFDTKSVIVASSAATQSVAEVLRASSDAASDESLITSTWTGDPSSRDIAPLVFLFYPPNKSNDMPRIESIGKATMVETVVENPLIKRSSTVHTRQYQADRLEPTSRLLR